MEGIIIFIAFCVGIYLIGAVISKISKAITKRKERIRDQVAEEVLSGLNIQSVIDGYKNKLEHIKYVRTDPLQKAIEGFNEWHGGRDSVLLGKCPVCEGGYLIIKNGKYGKFLACSKYPKCNYTKNIKKAREEYKETINEQIINDISRAYS